MPDKPYILSIMGPTAIGKTHLAIFLHEQLNSEIISVDSATIYRGLDIGTAKPRKDILMRVPHRLIDICDPVEVYSAARFQEDARQAIDEIIANNKIPILVGGTGLYFRILEQGLAKLPQANHHIRAQIAAEAKKNGWQALHKKLYEIDRDAAHRIDVNDPQRIQRALEVYAITGISMSSLLSVGRHKPLPYTIKKIVLAPDDRAMLHNKAERRFLEMLAAGFVDEVEMLYQRDDLSSEKPSMRLVGYRQIWHYLAGLSSYQEMQERAIVATRQLIKRQITWCRSELNANWYNPDEPKVYAKILADIQ